MKKQTSKNVPQVRRQSTFGAILVSIATRVILVIVLLLIVVVVAAAAHPTETSVSAALGVTGLIVGAPVAPAGRLHAVRTIVV
jgi:hypothetical protein